MKGRYITCESIVGKQNNILCVVISYTISNIMRIKPGAYPRWIITQEEETQNKTTKNTTRRKRHSTTRSNQ